MKYNPRPFERLLTRYIAAQSLRIKGIIDKYVDRVAWQVWRQNPANNGDFYFKQNPALSKSVDTLLRDMTNDIADDVRSGIEWSWNLANVKNDDLIQSIVSSIGAERIPAGAIARWTQKNMGALAAFEKRRITGMSLSNRVWLYNKGIKGDLELALGLGLAEGKSADQLSRTIRQYLKEPHRLYRRVRDEQGILRLSKAASNYHPGQGVYRSSYKNAQRLAATETNMAYRTADYERVKDMDFVLGIEVHLSNNHTCLDSKGVPQPFYDICDELQGRYPKDFLFKGWHPKCRCYTTTVLPKVDEFIEYLRGMDGEGNSSYKFKGEITEVPSRFKEWVAENKNRILTAEERGKLPYFIQDNKAAVMKIVNGTGAQYATLTDADIKFLSDNGIPGVSILVNDKNSTPQFIQSELARSVDRIAGFDIDNYVKIYGKKHPEVMTLSNEIRILRSRDEVSRLRKINELKNICGELSAKEVQKWGFAKGLEYVGVEKSKEYAESRVTRAGSRYVTIKGLRKDLIVFRSPESGKEFAYALGARKADITYDVAIMAQFVDKDMPAYLRNNLARVVFLNERNPYDKYWGATYKMPRFESFATDSGNVTYWRAVKTYPGQVNGALLHEAGHAFDYKRDITKTLDWKKAMEADIALQKEGKIANAFPTEYARQAYSASKDIKEDFAESVQKKIEWDKKYGEATFEKCFPNRFKALMRIISLFPQG